MKTFLFQQTQQVSRPLPEVFAFFSDARNLDRITPPWLRFEICTPGPIPMAVGTLIDYRLRWHGLPMRWRTRIEAWEPGRSFVDVQLRGPYRLWHHTHRFQALGDHTLIEDEVRYAVPFGPLGVIAHGLFVRRDVERIFQYRRRVIDELADRKNPLNESGSNA